MRYEMYISPKPFDMIKDGRKTIELRLYEKNSAGSRSVTR